MAGAVIRVEPPAAIARCGPGMVTDRAASAARAFPKVRVALGEPTEFHQDAEGARCADANRIRGDVLSIPLAAGKAAVSTDTFGRAKDAAALQVCHPQAHGFVVTRESVAVTGPPRGEWLGVLRPVELSS